MTPAQRINVTIEVNGHPVAARVEPRLLLVDFLRSNAAMKSVRIGCEEGACGACTVELDGKTVKSCLVFAVTADARSVTTVEGIGEGRALTRLQEAFVSCHALQCGYCTAGMLMSARAFLADRGEQDFDDDDIRQALTGNYCRCTGYGNIVHAVKVAAGRAEPLAEAEDAHRAGESWIGRPMARREDKRLVSGRGRYADNFGEASDLHAAAARSTRAHALIKHVDVTRAKDLPGVLWVMTGQQARAHWDPISPTMDLLDLNLPERYALAVDKVVYYGEPVALVVAETPYQAEDAARAIAIDYDDLPVNMDAEAAAQVAPDGDALLYPSWRTNVQNDFAFEHGDVDAAFDRADLVVDEHIVSHRFGAMPMETRVVRASFDPGDERLVIRSSTQVPHQMRMYMSRVFGIPETRIQVLSDDVGGGFGSKLSVDSEFLPVLATLLLGRPVNWCESRSEWLHAGPGARDYHTRSRAAFKRDGTIIVMETDVLADMGCDGAERGAGLGMPLNGGIYAPGPYRFDTYRTHVRCVVTNKGPFSAYRGYGKDLANLMMERVLDQAADQLEIDPVAIRQRNLLRAYPHQLCTGPIIENGSLGESLSKLVDMMDLPRLRSEQTEALAQGRYLGISVIPYIEPAGAAFPGSAFQNYESATMRIAPDGSVHVMTGIQSIGQGIETAYAQVAADILGCRFGDVTVSWGDTTATPFGSGTFSSRGAMYAVGAMLDAGKKLNKRIRSGAAVLLKCAESELDIKDAEITHQPSGKHCTLAELAYAAYVQPGAQIILAEADAPLLEATGTYRHPQVSWTPDELGRAQFYPAHANGAAGAFVEVDAETGAIDVKKIWMVADHGVVLNPLILQGQIKGSTVQQLGGTIYESLEYDDDGIPLANTMKEYGMPTVWAAPEIEIEHLVSKSPCTSIGAKGAGEDGSIATGTVLMGAVEDALRPFGVKVMASPLSPARIRALIVEAER